jgi:hypothetical protein
MLVGPGQDLFCDALVGHRPDHIFDGGGASHFLALSLLIDVRLDPGNCLEGAIVWGK